MIRTAIDFLGSPNYARASVIAVNVWRGIPFFTIGLMAGLPTHGPVYEAADIDGASPWIKFRRITLPLVMPLLAVITTFSIIWTFADFHLIWIMTPGRAGQCHPYLWDLVVPAGHSRGTSRGGGGYIGLYFSGPADLCADHGPLFSRED